jgi:hypothetical protein
MSKIIRIVVSALVLIGVPAGPLLAKAHCFCKIGPVSSPYADLGAIGTYGVQIGHDDECRSLCNDTANQYMSDPASKAAVCKQAGNSAFAAYSAVGTRPYQAGQTFTCPQTSPQPRPGSIRFPLSPGTIRVLNVNNIPVNAYPPGPLKPVIVPYAGYYTTFSLSDYLQFHFQSWTYTARLYRDGILIEQFSKPAGVGYIGVVQVTFTGQPNAFVHGHTWKVEWEFAGSGFVNGSVSFFIP